MLIFDILENDILLGRGALTVNNEGNKRFRTIVEPWKTEYRGGNRKRKNEIATIVVKEVFQRNGRFLERVSEEQLRHHGLPEQSRAWKVADTNVAMEKVSVFGMSVVTLNLTKKLPRQSKPYAVKILFQDSNIEMLSHIMIVKSNSQKK